MKNKKDFISSLILGFAAIFLINWFILEKYNKGLLGFLDSNIFIAETTLLVGLFAFLIYFKQKKDKKRDIANIILLEVRGAENGISSFFKKNAEPEKIDFFKTSFNFFNINSWDENKHLFVGELDSDEFSLIDSFYSDCGDIKDYLKAFDAKKAFDLKSENQHRIFYNALEKHIEEKEEKRKAGKLTPTVEENLVNSYKKCIANISDDANRLSIEITPAWFKENCFKKINDINFITTSTAGEKIKNIAK